MTAVITIKVKEDERLSGLGEHMRASRVQMDTPFLEIDPGDLVFIL